MLDGDRSSLFYIAQALMRLQGLFGTIPAVKGKGSAAAAVKNMLMRMRRELGADAPPLGNGSGILNAAVVGSDVHVC